ncbi:hypothetical protein ACFLTV_02210 [Chloroflexota bacterium]
MTEVFVLGLILVAIRGLSGRNVSADYPTDVTSPIILAIGQPVPRKLWLI